MRSIRRNTPIPVVNGLTAPNLAAGLPDGLRGGLGVAADGRSLLLKLVTLLFIERGKLRFGQDSVAGRFRLPVIGHDFRAFLGQADGDGPADSLAGAGDYGDFILQ